METLYKAGTVTDSFTSIISIQSEQLSFVCKRKYALFLLSPLLCIRHVKVASIIDPIAFSIELPWFEHDRITTKEIKSKPIIHSCKEYFFIFLTMKCFLYISYWYYKYCAFVWEGFSLKWMPHPSVYSITANLWSKHVNSSLHPIFVRFLHTTFDTTFVKVRRCFKLLEEIVFNRCILLPSHQL